MTTLPNKNDRRRARVSRTGAAATPAARNINEERGALSGASRGAISIVAGIATAFAFAPTSWFPLAWLGLAALFLCWWGASPRSAAWSGFGFGLGLFIPGTWWLYVAMMRHGGVSIAIGSLLCTLVILVQAAHVAVAGGLQALARRAPGWAVLALAMPASFAALEWLRGYTLSGFPWLVIGDSQIDGPLAGWAPIAGTHAVSLATAQLAGLVGLAVLRRKRFAIWTPLFALVIGVPFALKRIEWTAPAGPPITVGVIQGNIGFETKWTEETIRPTLEMYLRETRLLLERDRVKAVIWPETAVTIRADQAAPFLEALSGLLVSHEAGALVGIVSADRSGGVPRYFNTALAVGAAEGRYLKRHLVPLTEYLPEFLPKDWRDAKRKEAIGIFSAGPDDQPPIRIGGAQFGVTICYEAAFGALGRDPSGITSALVTLTNDDWFMGTPMPDQHLDIARMRALEAGRDLIRATNTGITALIGADGRLRKQLPIRQRASLVGDITPRVGLTPYWRMGDVVFIISVLATVLVVVGLVLRSRRNTLTDSYN